LLVRRGEIVDALKNQAAIIQDVSIHYRCHIFDADPLLGASLLAFFSALQRERVLNEVTKGAISNTALQRYKVAGT
jgi:hypothetical protein